MVSKCVYDHINCCAAKVAVCGSLAWPSLVYGERGSAGLRDWASAAHPEPPSFSVP